MMKQFIQEVIQDIQLVVSNFECVVGESEEAITLSSSIGNSAIENTSFSKNVNTEDLLRSIISDLSEMISDSEPLGIVVEPKVECEFKVSDPFFDNLDECTGGFYPSYRMNDCARMIGRVAKYLSAIGFLQIDKTNLKEGVFLRLHNRDSDIRISLRLGKVNQTPILILRFGDYRNFNVVTQVIDGASSKDGKMNFMAIEFISTIIPKMIELSQDLIIKRHHLQLQSERIVEKLFKELGWTNKKQKK